MYRIRLHGRGGQGMKTASRILGTAFFRRGFEVQDAPRYGAERRGAPVFAYVRASRLPIHERGVIARPDLVVVADDTLVTVAAAGVVHGLAGDTVLLVNSAEKAAVWRQRIAAKGPVLVLPATPEERAELRFVGGLCAAAAARLVGVLTREDLEAAMREELAAAGADVVAANLEAVGPVWDALTDAAGCVREGADAADVGGVADWIELPPEPARVAAPDIYASATSVEVRTGLWRTVRPVVDHERCRRCSWICSTLCPDSCIEVDAEHVPHIDLDHCKGCGICAAVCPPHAIALIPEARADVTDGPKEEASP